MTDNNKYNSAAPFNVGDIPCFKNHMRGSYHFYGHVHNSWEWEMMEKMKKEMEGKNTLCNMYNVGCMMEYMNYTPRTFGEIVGE